VSIFLDYFNTLLIDTQTANLAAQLRRETRLKLPDAFQAALAKQHKLFLATRNTKDFSPKKHPYVCVPYTI